MKSGTGPIGKPNGSGCSKAGEPLRRCSRGRRERRAVVLHRRINSGPHKGVRSRAVKVCTLVCWSGSSNRATLEIAWTSTCQREGQVFPTTEYVFVTVNHDPTGEAIDSTDAVRPHVPPPRQHGRHMPRDRVRMRWIRARQTPAGVQASEHAATARGTFVLPTAETAARASWNPVRRARPPTRAAKCHRAANWVVEPPAGIEPHESREPAAGREG